MSWTWSFPGSVNCKLVNLVVLALWEQVSRMAGVTEGQNDDELDKLLRKAVTVSQVNLPIATIDKDIDDIANSYAEENQHPDKTLDKDFVVIICIVILVFQVYSLTFVW